VKFIWRVKPLSDVQARTICPKGKEKDKVEILVIDDERLAQSETLRARGYRIREQKDIVDLKAVEAYEVILCDIRGVGKSFNSPFEGAYVMSEIKKRYPYKIVIAYSGSSYDVRYSDYLKKCNGHLIKDDGIERWQEVLDAAVSDAVDPVLKWRSIHAFLVSREASAYDIFRIEQAYIRAVIDNNPRLLQSRDLQDGLTQDVRSIVNNMVASIIFSAAT